MMQMMFTSMKESKEDTFCFHYKRKRELFCDKASVEDIFPERIFVFEFLRRQKSIFIFFYTI
jgi:hypothetical protein